MDYTASMITAKDPLRGFLFHYDLGFKRFPSWLASGYQQDHWASHFPFFRTRTEKRKIIDYKISIITDEDPLRGCFFYEDLGFSHTQNILGEKSCGERIS